MSIQSLLNPTSDLIESTLFAAIDSANHGQRVRTVSHSEVANWSAKILDAPEGSLGVDGGAVPNCYRGRALAAYGLFGHS